MVTYDIYSNLDLYESKIYNSGFEIVDELPTKDLFNGKQVTLNGLRYIYVSNPPYATGWIGLDEINENLAQLNNYLYRNYNKSSIYYNTIFNNTKEFPIKNYFATYTSCLTDYLEYDTTYTISYNYQLLTSYGYDTPNSNSRYNSSIWIHPYATYGMIPNGQHEMNHTFLYDMKQHYMQYSFSIPSSITQQVHLLFYSGINGDIAKITNLKIEKGNYATPWIESNYYKKTTKDIPNTYVYAATISNTIHTVSNHNCGNNPVVQVLNEGGNQIYADIHTEDKKVIVNTITETTPTIILNGKITQ